MGAHIGNIGVMAPTCADDIAILGTSGELQALIDIVEHCTKRDFVKINPSKSDLVPLMKTDHNIKLHLGNDEIIQKEETKHLGIKRNCVNVVNIEERLQTARKTVYALLGPGLHARRGVSPLIAGKIWKTYVIPRSLYGIEVLNYSQTDIEKMEKLQIKICRQIQGLPQRTAKVAVYILIGMEPIEAVVDRLVLTFAINILQDKNSLEFRIIERQLGMAKSSGQVFICKVVKLLKKYGLPEIEHLIENTPGKLKWKKLLKKHIGNFWENTWKEEIQTKPTLKNLNMHCNPLRKPHQVWKSNEIFTK